MREVLERLVSGKISIEEAEKTLRIFAIQSLGNVAKLDINREFRKGIPEIILAEGKTPKTLAEIVSKGLKSSERIIISRIEEHQIKALRKHVPKSFVIQVNENARVVVLKKKSFMTVKTGGIVGILTAGTSDIPVAEEARIIAEEMGCEVFTAYDVGVAGIHRLFLPLKTMLKKDVDVIIVVAGREGALPSVVAGMIDIPIIAVPTSFGYGFGEKGVSALTAMLQACSLGIGVVNIDCGIGAGAVAALIANRTAKFKENRKTELS